MTHTTHTTTRPAIQWTTVIANGRRYDLLGGCWIVQPPGQVPAVEVDRSTAALLEEIITLRFELLSERNLGDDLVTALVVAEETFHVDRWEDRDDTGTVVDALRRHQLRVDRVAAAERAELLSRRG